MKTIRLLKKVVTNELVAAPDTVVEVAAELADRLIAAGVAELA